MTHMQIIADKTFNIIKDMNSKRKFANIYWTDICLSRKNESLEILLFNLSEVFKSKEIILNVLFVKNKKANYYSLDLDNVNIKNISLIGLKSMMAKKEFTNYIMTNKISLIVLDEVIIDKLDRIKCVNKIIITKECYIKLDYIKYKEYKLINST